MTPTGLIITLNTNINQTSILCNEWIIEIKSNVFQYWHRPIDDQSIITQMWSRIIDCHRLVFKKFSVSRARLSECSRYIIWICSPDCIHGFLKHWNSVSNTTQAKNTRSHLQLFLIWIPLFYFPNRFLYVSKTVVLEIVTENKTHGKL